VTGNIYAFAAVKSDGSVVTWGDAVNGGDSSAVAAQLSGGVQSVTGNNYAFAAVKSDGSVVTWGRAEFGGDSSGVAAQLSGGVQAVAGREAFCVRGGEFVKLFRVSSFSYVFFVGLFLSFCFSNVFSRA